MYINTYTYDVTYVVCWFCFAHLEANKFESVSLNTNQETIGNPFEKCCQGCLEVRSLELRRHGRMGSRDQSGKRMRRCWRINDWKNTPQV